MVRIQIGGRTYTEEDIRMGRHHDDPNVDTDTAESQGVINIADREATCIQAGAIRGGITFD